MPRELQIDDAALWKRRFRAPTIFATQLAKKEPTRGIAITNQTGIHQLYAWDVPSGKLAQLTDYPEGKMGGYIAPDGKHVYYLHDQQGNEIGHFVRMPYEGGEREDITPGLPPYSSFLLAISEAGNEIGLTTGTGDGFRLYVIELGPNGELGPPKLLYHSEALVYGPTLSYGGEIAVMRSTARTGKFQFNLLAFDTASGDLLAELWDGEGSSLQQVCFSPLPDDMRLLATTNRTGVETLLLWNPRTGERTDLKTDGLTGSMNAFDWSRDGERILFCTFDEAVQQFFIYHLADDTVTKLNHPPGSSFTPPYFGPAGDIYIHLQNALHPAQLIALDGQAGTEKRVILAAGEVPPGHPWESITFPSCDGQEIQGWLAVPEGTGPFPTILETHGGPSAVQEEEFSPASQAWVDHGFAYLTINYRGSITFGREFQEQIYGHPGDWEVQDMVAAREWLIEQGIAIPGTIFLTGWSYGGYLTLHALGKCPDLWAGGMAGTAIADWTVMAEDSAEMLRGYQAALFGGTPGKKPEAHAASSPITYAEQVSAPVLIIQGRNDTRTPPRPVEMYEKKMKALKKPITVHWFDAGHVGPYAQPEQAIKYQEIMLRFAYRVLADQEPEPDKPE